MYKIDFAYLSVFAGSGMYAKNLLIKNDNNIKNLSIFGVVKLNTFY